MNATARAVLRLSDDADKLAIIKKAGEDGLSVKDTERLVEKKLNSLFDSKKDGCKAPPVIMRIVKDYRMFEHSEFRLRAPALRRHEC